MSFIEYCDGTPVRVGDFFESDRNRRYLFKVYFIDLTSNPQILFYVTYHLDGRTPISPRFVPKKLLVPETGVLRNGIKKYKKPARKSGFSSFMKKIEGKENVR